MAKTTSGRVLIPRNTTEGLKLSADVYAKHKADGATSELKNLDGYDWDVIGPTIATAQGYDAAAADFKSKMEAQYRLRDALAKPIDEITRATAKYLKGKYAKNPKKLGDWKFAVDDTPPAKKAPKAKRRTDNDPQIQEVFSNLVSFFGVFQEVAVAVKCSSAPFTAAL